MDKQEIAKIFFNQEIIKFNKGYKLFEEVYNELKDQIEFIRKEDGDTVIIIHKYWYGKENK